MASQPPIQFNPMSPSIPNVAGLSRPPLLQPNTSNGMGQPPSGSTFPQSSTSNFAPVLSNTPSLQWSRPPILGQGSTLHPISQSSSISNQQQYNPAIHGPNLPPRPAMTPTLNTGRLPSASSMNSLPPGILFVVLSFFFIEGYPIKLDISPVCYTHT